MDEGIAINHHRFTRMVAASILAASVMLTGACDHDRDQQDEGIVSTRSASSAIVADMGLADAESWVVLESGQIKGWGARYCSGGECLAPAEIATLEFDEPAIEVHSNGESTVALLADGTVYTWGDTLAQTLAPQPLDSFDNAVDALALGEDFVCGLLQGGDVQCLATGGGAPPPWLAGVELPNQVVAVTAGASHACALDDAGAVTCWGDNGSGQLGSPYATGPTPIALPVAATQVSAGGEHTCALLETGAVRCWGSNSAGQLGYAGTGIGSVPIDESIEQIAAGAAHTCAIAQPSGDLYCWGSNAEGQLGQGDDLGGGIRKVDLAGQAADRVMAGPTARTTFAVLDHGGLRGWGLDDVGQMGYGEQLDDDTTTRAVGNLPDIIIYQPPVN